MFFPEVDLQDFGETWIFYDSLRVQECQNPPKIHTKINSEKVPPKNHSKLTPHTHDFMKNCEIDNTNEILQIFDEKYENL